MRHCFFFVVVQHFENRKYLRLCYFILNKIYINLPQSNIGIRRKKVKEAFIWKSWWTSYSYHNRIAQRSKNTRNMQHFLAIRRCLFIGPRYTWGPIYGSESVKLSYLVETYTSFTSYTSCTSCTSCTSYTSYRLFTSYRLYTEKVTVSSGAIWWPNLELMQVVPSGGQICN